MSNELKEALGLVQECLDDWPYAAIRVIPIMNRLKKVKELLLKEQEQKLVCPKCNGQPKWVTCGICGQVVKLDE